MKNEILYFYILTSSSMLFTNWPFAKVRRSAIIKICCNCLTSSLWDTSGFPLSRVRSTCSSSIHSPFKLRDRTFPNPAVPDPTDIASSSVLFKDAPLPIPLDTVLVDAELSSGFSFSPIGSPDINIRSLHLSALLALSIFTVVTFLGFYAFFLWRVSLSSVSYNYRRTLIQMESRFSINS